MENDTYRLAYPFLRGPSDWAVYGIAALLGALFAWYIYELGLILMLVDQYSHLSIARQITDSLTPGVSQIGFWPPLLHVLMMPFTLSDFLYFSGLAAPALLVPVMALGAVFMYSIVYLLGGYRIFGYAAAAAFVLNPYILYYSVTPMTEVLFIVMMLGSVYFLLHWWETQSLPSLVWLGAFITLASLARFEGFMLIPVAGLTILFRLWRDNRPLYEIEATLTMFALVAGIGVASTLAYGLVFADNPLAFMNGEWSAHAQQRDYFLPAERNIFEALRYMMHASIHMIGTIPIALAFVGAFFLPLLARHRRQQVLALLFIMATPLAFDVLALYQGSAIVYLPELPPYEGQYFNVRYALFLIGLVSVVPTLVAAYLYREASHSLPTRFVGTVAASFIVCIMLFQIPAFAGSALCADCFELVTRSKQVSPPDQDRAAYVLAHEYDGGRILMTRALQNAITVNAGIPLHRFILEANEHYYDQALGAPWLYARWVVMFNSTGDIPQNWFQEHELVSLIWGNSEDFEYFYELVYENDLERVYKLREERVRAEILTLGLPLELVPSLDETVDPWNTEQTHEELWLPYKAKGLLRKVVEAPAL